MAIREPRRMRRDSIMQDKRTIQTLSESAPFALLLVGAVIFHLSLYSLSTSNPFPLGVLIFGMIVQAVSVTLFIARILTTRHELTGREKSLQILYVLGLSLSLSFTRLSRYAGFNGFDFVYEGSVLQHVVNTGYWGPDLGYVSNYQSSLAITIIPVLTGGATGFSGQTIFLFQTFFLTSLLPMVLHPIINRFTANFRLATLSSLLLAQNWFFYGQHLIGKTAVALFLAVLAFYCLTHKNRGFQSLGVLLSLGVGMSHYTIALFLLFVFLSYFAFSRIIVPALSHVPSFRRIAPLEIALTPIAASAMIMLVWIAFAAPLILPTAVSSAQQSLASLGQTLSGRPGVALATSSSAGPIVTGWFDLQNALIGIGGLYLLYGYKKGFVRDNLATMTLVGLSLIGLLGIWLVLPFLSVRVETTRILQMILPFTIIFLAVLLMSITRMNLAFSKLGLVAVLALVLLMLPMNMMVANQANNPLYHTASSLPLAKQIDDDSSLIPSYSNYAVMTWVNGYLPPNKQVEVDSVGRYAFITALPFPPSLNFSQEEFPPYTFHRYTILSSYFIDNNIWAVTILGSSVPITGQDSSIWFSQPSHNVLYSSPKFWIMSPCSGPLCGGF